MKDLALPMDSPHTIPNWLEQAELWLAKLTALAGGLWAVWKLARASGQRLRAFVTLIGRFANAVDALNDINSRLAILNYQLHTHSELYSEPFWKTDAQGNCFYANSAYQRLVELPLTDIQGNNWEQSVHPEDMDWVNAEFRESISKGVPFSRDFRLLINGKAVRVRARHLPIKDNTGKVLEYHGTWTVLKEKN